MTHKTLLCFDYGTKRIGVAVGQSITGTASPLDIIHVHNNRPDWKAIAHLIDNWKPDALVVGVPLQMDSKRQDMTIAADKFARQLEGRFHLQVYGIDERLSSFEAEQRTNKKTSLDAVAAQAILETWFAENNNSSLHYNNGESINDI